MVCAPRTVSTLKFVGTISLGLLTGFSYTLSTLTLPTLLTLPSASTASKAFSNLTSLSLTHLRALATISSSSFFLSYLLSPRSQRHPYLLWTTLFVSLSSITDLALPYIYKTSEPAPRAQKKKDVKGKGRARQMDMSYEVLGASDRDSEGTISGEEADVAEEDVNGEEVRVQMEGFMVSQIVRTVVSGMAFAMGVVGIWGDGVGELVIIEV